MPVVSFKEIITDAFQRRYGVGAFNIFNDLSLEAVLQAAEEARAPVIVQTSVKTVKAIGIDTLYAMWEAMTKDLHVPVCLHLDHCPDRAMISACLAKGWGSVLFDAHALPLEENRCQTIEVVAEARRTGAGVEGEIEGIRGVEDGTGSDAEAERKSLEAALDFIRATRIDCFAPAIGNAHGVYKESPRLDVERVTRIVNAEPVPIALHGGTGLSDEQFRDLVGRGCAKVNISTQIKIDYMKASLAFLRRAEAENKWDPPALFKSVNATLKETVRNYIAVFGSEGKAG